MYLRKDTAAKIIEEVSMILDHDINIMDEKGVILASTNPSRVGMFHEGAFELIRSHLKELCIYQDGQYHGCRKGINLPVCLGDKIIGVIGITGEVTEVMKYGKVLKKMTEILVLDLFSYHKKSQQEQTRLFFVNEWLHKETEELPASFHDQLRNYGFSENSPFLAAVIQPARILEGAEPFAPSRYLCVQNGDMGIIICNSKETEKLPLFVKTAARSAKADAFVCAVGSVQPDYRGVRQSYSQAVKLWNLKKGQSGIFFYEDSAVELLLHDVSPEYKRILVNQLLSGFTEDEIKEFTDFMEVYVKHNGSISRIAEELFIHKNTVQYKIGKLRKKTGKDPRLIKDVILLDMVAGWVRNPSK